MLNFSAHSLDNHLHGEKVRRILQLAMEAADPRRCLPRFVRRDGNLLIVDGRSYALDDFSQLYVLSVGKAAEAMADSLLPLLDDRLSGGLIITKHASRAIVGRLAVMDAGHPLPDARSLVAGQRVLNLLSHLRPDDLLICLISGGASALMTAPVDGISLDDLRNLTSLLLADGASIDELNAVRKQLDQLKGGGLARRSSANVVSLILSDVVGDRLDLIASGPTVPESTSTEDIERIVTRYKLASRLPSHVLTVLTQISPKIGVQTLVCDDQRAKARTPEIFERTNKPEASSFDHVQNVIVGSNRLAARAAMDAAKRKGFHARILTTTMQGEARVQGVQLAMTLRRARTRPLCLIAGGETTVTVTGNGLGGRNQELALAAAQELDGLRDVMLLSFATDGDDGPTGAAGAVVTGETLLRSHELGLDDQDFLLRNDSHTFFNALNDLLIPGLTGTNVNDLVLLFKF